MTNKNVDDYLQDGIYGSRLPNQAERDKFLGSLRERVVFVLTIGEVMQNKGRSILEDKLKEHSDAKILINGTIASKFFGDIRQLASQFDIQYTSITNEDVDTNIGMVLTYSHAIHEEVIYLTDLQSNHVTENKSDETEIQPEQTLFTKIKSWFK